MSTPKDQYKHDMDLRDLINQWRRNRSAHMIDESDYVDEIMAIIEREKLNSRIEAIQWAGLQMTEFPPDPHYGFKEPMFVTAKSVFVKHMAVLKAELSEGETKS